MARKSKKPHNRREYEQKKAIEKAINRQTDKNLPIAQWSLETLMSVASDRGYRSESSLSLAISREFGIPFRSAEHIIKTGRMTWGQVACLGSFLEMTPKEFCDTFLHGYFIETTQGTFQAHVDSYAPLLQKPK